MAAPPGENHERALILFCSKIAGPRTTHGDCCYWEIMPQCNSLFSITPSPSIYQCRNIPKTFVPSSWALSMWILLTIPLTSGIQGIGQLVRIKYPNPGLRLSFGSVLDLHQIYAAGNLKNGLSDARIVNIVKQFEPIMMIQTDTISALRGGYTPTRGKKSKSKRKPLSLKYKIQKRILSVSN